MRLLLLEFEEGLEFGIDRVLEELDVLVGLVVGLVLLDFADELGFLFNDFDFSVDGEGVVGGDLVLVVEEFV